MPKVILLSEITANKIAAGEVVERPASVVKELIENSLDAGSTHIAVEIEKGGSDLIRVSDNGYGMSRGNAVLSIERFATSKLTNDDDLFSIKTFGFRGEALPSIASVSQFTMITREQNCESGTKIEISGGKVVNISETGSPEGTMVEVKNLYFNTPARRKFLKTVNTEMGHIAYNVSSFALAYPHVQFTLVHNGRNVKHFSESDDLLSRVAIVLGLNGDESINDLYSLENEYSNQRGVHITGYITKSSITRNSSNNILLFVNKRLISDRSLISAVVKGYQGRLMKGQFPMAALFIQIPFDEVDVNVHPAKLQVRFANQSLVFGSVVNTVHNALFHGENRSRRSYEKRDSDYGNRDNPYESRERIKKIDNYEAHEYLPKFSKHDIDNLSARLGRSRLDNIDSTKLSNLDTPSLFNPTIDKVIGDDSAKKNYLNQKVKFSEPYQMSDLNSDQISNLNLTQELSGLNIIGQFSNSYIILQSSNTESINLNKSNYESNNIKTKKENQLFLIDQHAAHERVVYEKLKKRSQGSQSPSQDLIIPEIVDFNYKEACLIESILPQLAQLGIEIEHFGGTTFVVKSIPAIIDDRAVKQILKEMVEILILEGIESNSSIIGQSQGIWLDKILITMACHSAVRANHQLNQQEIKQLLLDLEKCDNPYNCPHGRPTIISFSQKEIEKRFKRTKA